MITRCNIYARIAAEIILIQLILCASVNAQQSRLPPCPTDQSAIWNDCYGKHTAPNGEVYIGEFKNGKYEGKGKIILVDGRQVVGEFKNDKVNGMAETKWTDGVIYKGEAKDNVPHGQGTFTWPDGDKWVGEIVNGKRTGQGTYTSSKGTTYVGNFKDGSYDGHGTLIWLDSKKKENKYIGEFRDGKYNGQGSLTLASGEKYVGEFSEDKFNGQGTHSLPDGSKYIGEFKDYKKHGKGILYDEEGTPRKMGIWENNKYIRHEYISRNSTAPPAPKISSGTAFRIANGQFITNHHVIERCTTLWIAGDQGARVLASDPINDIALVSLQNDSGEIASIRTTRTQLNEAITAAGFPLHNIFSGIAITNGTISRLSGLKGDTGQLQISAPVQPGSSGGPLLDSSGNVIGMVSGKLNEVKWAGATGNIPQNVNFAISGNTLRAFLEAKGVNYREVGRDPDLRGEQIAAKASAFTVLIECK